MRRLTVDHLFTARPRGDPYLGSMRDVALFLAVIAGAVAIGVVGGSENWLHDRPGLVVLLYLGAVFGAILLVADVRSPRRR